MPMVHEFGIMSTNPKPSEQFNDYEPQKYNCITVHDEIVEHFGDAVLRDLPCYWCTIDRPETGLAYCGITLIPPASLPVLQKASSSCADLQKLITQAMDENRFIIHFGL